MKKINCNLGLVLSNKEDCEKAKSFSSITNFLFQGDLIHLENKAWINPIFSKSIYALNSDKYGGQSTHSLAERTRLLIQAALYFKAIQLEYHHDLTAAVLEKIPKEKRWIVWKGNVSSSDELEAIFKKMKQIGAAHYQIITTPKNSAETLIPLAFLKQHPKENLSAFAAGPLGMWTQILALYFGSKWIFGKTEKAPSNLFTVDQLIKDYNVLNLRPFSKIYGILGRNVIASLSPRLHNQAYQQLNIPALYLPFNAITFQDFKEGILDNPTLPLLNLNICGLTIVAPFKETSLPFATSIDSNLVQLSKSSNLFIQKDKAWFSQTTDSLGVLNGLKKRKISPKGLKTAILGCGGAGRTIAAALKQKQALVTLVNRSIHRGTSAANLLQLPFVPLAEFVPEDFDLIVNAINLGKTTTTLAFEVQRMHKKAILVDMSYNTPSTFLTKEAKTLGIEVIDGFEILNEQVRNQFFLLTNCMMPDNLSLAPQAPFLMP